MKVSWNKMKMSLLQLLKQYSVVIPSVQRDYAQGREYGSAPRVRERFLQAIFNALRDQHSFLELDFIYGYNREFKFFTPLDGQQRLTTLFLLHWYYAAKEGYLGYSREYLANFTYETRRSSEFFCGELIHFRPDNFQEPLKDIIIDQPWFFPAWVNDPTVTSMLNMLNSIQAKDIEYGLEKVWLKLTEEKPPIYFYFLSMDDLNLPDDLYIKMNSRGKELTEFEYFKNQFNSSIPESFQKDFKKKIDQDWLDLFWDLFKIGNHNDLAALVDEGFMRYYKFISDLLAYQDGINPVTDVDDCYSLYKVSPDNIMYLFKSMDVLYKDQKNNQNLFNQAFYINAENRAEHKVRLFFINRQVNLLKACADNYDLSKTPNPFSIGEQLLLYACIEHLRNEKDAIFDRLRMLRNLIDKSEDTLRRENMAALLNNTHQIVNMAVIDGETVFSSRQLEEELRKNEFIMKNPTKKDVLHRLEDHDMLRGCLALFDLNLEIEKYSIVFEQIFNGDNDLKLISKALLVFGDYSQRHGNRNRFGTRNLSVWREMFTPSLKRDGFDKTKRTFYKLMNYMVENPDASLQQIVDNYIAEHQNNPHLPKDWRFYFIKYDQFTVFKEGYYIWDDMSKKPYECFKLNVKTHYGHNWSPFLSEINNCKPHISTLENYGAPLLMYNNNHGVKIKNINCGYLVEPFEDENSQAFIEIIISTGLVDSECRYIVKQDIQGLDLEDRVERGLELIDCLHELLTDHFSDS